ncbi:hypothetical protein TNCV_5040851 [Trichonephila clavipes]|nr:hypothetical protein TNCV_5040851 [Trichonephila clavipes]
MKPHRKKSNRGRSGDHGGYSTPPLYPVILRRKQSMRKFREPQGTKRGQGNTIYKVVMRNFSLRLSTRHQLQKSINVWSSIWLVK